MAAKTSHAVAAGNLIVGAVLFAGVFLMNMKSIGRGSLPMFAVPAAAMTVAMYECFYLVMTDGKSHRTKWRVLAAFAGLSLLALACGLGPAG